MQEARSLEDSVKGKTTSAESQRVQTMAVVLSSARVVPTAAWYRRGESGDLGRELVDQAGEFVAALAWCEGLLRILLQWQEEATPLAWAARIEGAYKELLESPSPSLDSANALARQHFANAGLDVASIQSVKGLIPHLKAAAQS